MGDERQIVLERNGSVAWLRINHPERLNSFVNDMRGELEEGLIAVEEDSDIRCVIITGTGRSFSTGGDVRAMKKLLEEDDADGFGSLVRAGERVVRRIQEMPKPVIACVNGVAAGAGASLALACDLRIASESASIGFTFLRVGLVPDWGGSYFLPRLVGPALAAELVFTGGMISAERAERLGVFNRVVPAGELEAAARGFAGEIASGPPLAVARAKRMLRRSLGTPLPEMLEMETRAQMEAFQSPDALEGITAFLEKRAPRFGRQQAAAPGDEVSADPAEAAEEGEATQPAEAAAMPAPKGD